MVELQHHKLLRLQIFVAEKWSFELACDAAQSSRELEKFREQLCTMKIGGRALYSNTMSFLFYTRFPLPRHAFPLRTCPVDQCVP